MTAKLQSYIQLAGQTAALVTKNIKNWVSFLNTASRLYRYPFPDALMIHAQRPKATACASYEIWNRRMRRSIRRGSKGIGLVNVNRRGYPVVKHVFDIKDTVKRKDSCTPFLWKYKEEYQGVVTKALEERFGIRGDCGLVDLLQRIAGKLAEDYWENYHKYIVYECEGSHLEGLDEFSIGSKFRLAVAVSVSYVLIKRCGLNPQRHFTAEDFQDVPDFDTQRIVKILGTAVCQSNEQVLRTIAVAIYNYSQSTAVREYLAERADLLGAVRLPNTAFKANAGTDVVSDVLFLQKRDTPATETPEWVQTGKNIDGFIVNNYFTNHPDMVLGTPSSESTPYGTPDYTVMPVPGVDLAMQLQKAVSFIHGTYQEVVSAEPDKNASADMLQADTNVKNYSFTLVDGAVYYREIKIFQEYTGVKDRQRLLTWQLEQEVSRDILPILNYMTAHKFIWYVDSQYGFLRFRKTPYGALRYRGMQALVSEYRDYLDICHKLGYDMKSSFVLYPKDLQKSHDSVSRRLKHKHDAKVKKNFKAVYQEISGKLDFEQDGMKILYPATPDEVVAEGHALHHCVGRYVERVAKRECLILFLRQCSDEDEPFYTIEVRDNKAVQVRGMKNCDMTPAVEAFITAWEERVLSARLSQVA